MSTNLEGLQMALFSAYASFLQAVKQLDPDKRRIAGVCGDWSPKDVVSHLIGWDRALREFIIDPDTFDPAPLYDTDSFNAKSVSDRQHQSWDETVDALQSGFEDMQKAIAAVTPVMKIFGRVTDWVTGRTADYAFHTSQLEEWLEQQDNAAE